MPVFTIKSERELVQITDFLVPQLRAGDVILLRGDLGAGKTTFVRYLLAALHSPQKAKSPTYTILREYETDLGALLHFDLYRLAGADDLDALGWDELVAGAALTVVEWLERLEERTPRGAWELDFVVREDDVREVRCERG